MATVAEDTGAIERNYGRSGLVERTLAALNAAGLDPKALDRNALQPLDEFHIRGRAATRELAALAGLSTGAHVVDVGCGVGGPARTLAAEIGCRVTGLDLMPEYCDLADLLTAGTGLSDRVTVRQGSALEMPFDDGAFDAASRIDEFMASGYRAMVALREQGTVKAIGGGLNEWEACQILAERGDFDLFLLAGRYTLLEQEALESFLPLCEKRGIGVVIGGPYNSGILASGPGPGAFYNYRPAPEPIRERVARLDAVCRSHGVPLVDAAFQFPLRHPCVVSVIPGGQGVSEIESNLRAAEAHVPPALWDALKVEGLMRADAPTGPPQYFTEA